MGDQLHGEAGFSQHCSHPYSDGLVCMVRTGGGRCRQHGDGSEVPRAPLARCEASGPGWRCIRHAVIGYAFCHRHFELEMERRRAGEQAPTAD